MREIVCKCCYSPFEATGPNRKYCSRECYNEGNRKAMWSKGYLDYTIRLSRLYSMAKNRAAKKNVPFTITTKDLIELWDYQDGCCAISGLPFDLSASSQKGTPRFNTVSVDRIEPYKGYTRNNIRLVCYQINVGIAEFGAEHFIELCKIISENNS